MCSRFTVLSESPMAAAIAGCAIPLSRSNTIWMRLRCTSGIFQRNAVFNCRIWALPHLIICSPSESDGQSESHHAHRRQFPSVEYETSIKTSIQSAMEAVLHHAPATELDHVSGK